VKVPQWCAGVQLVPVRVWGKGRKLQRLVESCACLNNNWPGQPALVEPRAAVIPSGQQPNDVSAQLFIGSSTIHTASTSLRWLHGGPEINCTNFTASQFCNREHHCWVNVQPCTSYNVYDLFFFYFTRRQFRSASQLEMAAAYKEYLPPSLVKHSIRWDQMRWDEIRCQTSFNRRRSQSTLHGQHDVTTTQRSTEHHSRSFKVTSGWSAHDCARLSYM